MLGTVFLVASAVQHSKSTILDVDMHFIQDTLTRALFMAKGLEGPNDVCKGLVMA